MLGPIQSHRPTAAPASGLDEARQARKSLVELQPTDGYVGDAEAKPEVESALRRMMAGVAPTTTQFADSNGRVKHLALMFSSAYLEDGAAKGAREQVLNAYKTLFTRMEPDTKFTIVCATEQDKALVEGVVHQDDVPNPDRIQLLLPGEANLTVWARDMMVPKFKPGDPAHTAIMAQEPLHNWHLSDSKIPKVITEANPSISLDVPTALVTDGGDTTSNTRESFAGYYSLAATENKLYQALIGTKFKDEVLHWYQDRNQVKVIETPPETTFPFRFVPVEASDGTKITRMEGNPDYRVPEVGAGEVSEAQMFDDLAVGLFRQDLGKPVTIMGRDDLKTPMHEEPATDHMDMGMTPIDDKTFLLGDPTMTRELLRGTKHDYAAFFNRDHAWDFDAYQRTLEQKGYRVVRVPHHEPAKLGDPYISYNNCLMERFEKDGQQVRRVFLPMYGLPELDERAKEIWNGEGFEVIPMPLDKLSSNWGALRCISNWLDRSPQG